MSDALDKLKAKARGQLDRLVARRQWDDWAKKWGDHFTSIPKDEVKLIVSYLERKDLFGAKLAAARAMDPNDFAAWTKKITADLEDKVRARAERRGRTLEALEEAGIGFVEALLFFLKGLL